MTIRFGWGGICSIAVALAGLAPTGVATAAEAGISWAQVASWPDFTSGVWAENFVFDPNAKAPLKPTAADELVKAKSLDKLAVGGSNSCLPPGMPGVMSAGLPWAFFYARDSIFIITDMDNLEVRRVLMGRKDHGDPDPSWNGHSIGHWEGQTLVIDTTAIMPRTKLAGLPSGGSTHIVERIRLLGPEKLEWKLRIMNPDLLTQPWEWSKTFERHRDWEIQDARCVEGNRDAPDAAGNPHVDLTPPK
jgi:hypothetical protein